MPRVFERDGYKFFFTVTSTGPYMFMCGMGAGRLFSKWKKACSCANRRDLRFASWPRRRRLQPSNEALFYKGGMSILTDSARSAVFRGGQIIIAMESGSEIRFPVAANPRLARGTRRQLSRIEISPYGLHWPDLDEDLSFRGLLRGDYGQHQKVEPGAAPSRRPSGRRAVRATAKGGGR